MPEDENPTSLESEAPPEAATFTDEAGLTSDDSPAPAETAELSPEEIRQLQQQRAASSKEAKRLKEERDRLLAERDQAAQAAQQAAQNAQMIQMQAQAYMMGQQAAGGAATTPANFPAGAFRTRFRPSRPLICLLSWIL